MTREVQLRRYPDGAVCADDFTVVETALPELRDGDVCVEVNYLSMDPVVRTRMTPSPAMGPPLPLDVAVGGRGVGRVSASRAAAMPVGTRVYGELGWREQAVLPAALLERLPDGDVPLHHYLNALGPTGLAAYFVVESLAPRAGETVFITPAAGAVGSMAAQLALRHGASVIGTGVGAVQFDYLRKLGVVPIAPDGDLPGDIDMFIDGVGGALHDRVVARLKPRARIVLLGFLSDYGSSAPLRYGSMAPILLKRACVQGFLLADHMGHADEARAQLAGYVASGVLVPAEQIWNGLEQAPHAFAVLFGEALPGKQIVRVTGDHR